jgi:hypothetical protein
MKNPKQDEYLDQRIVTHLRLPFTGMAASLPLHGLPNALFNLDGPTQAAISLLRATRLLPIGAGAPDADRIRERFG